MAGENTGTTMEMYKEIYGDTLDDVVPASSVLTDLIPFPDEDKLGDSYRQSVVLTSEHGFTYNGSGAGLATLNAPVQATIKEANHSGFEMIGRAKITYAAASRGLTSRQAFKSTWGTVLMNLRKASMKHLELSLLMGQDGLGEVLSLSTETATMKDPSGWSTAIWAGMEGAVVEAWTTRAATATEHGVTTGSTIASVALGTPSITSGTGGFSGGTAVAAGDFLYFFGARTSTGYNEMVGLRKMAGNTGSLFGIDAASYNLWAGNTKSSLGTPTMGKMLDAVTAAVEKGLDEKAYLLVCPKTWEVLNSDLASKREFDGSYNKARAENGAQAIVYYGQLGEVEVRVHPFLLRGEAGLFPLSCLKRIGSADIGMGVPGLTGGDGSTGRDIFFHIEANNAVEARSFTDQALFCDAPSKLTWITGITYA